MTKSTVLLEREINNFYNIGTMSLEQTKKLILQSWIEVQNGLEVDCLNFYHRNLKDSETKKIIKSCISEIEDVPFFEWKVDYFIVDFNPNYITLISVYKDKGYKLNHSKKQNTQQQLNSFANASSIKEKAIFLDDLTNQNLNSELISLLVELASEPHLLTSTLASELLTLQGKPTVPKKFINEYSLVRPKNQKAIKDKNDNLMFEDRIDVDSYNYFELVHPAYAKQTVALINLIESYYPEYQSETDHIIDFGTGPGTSLVMLLEALPLLKVHAVEPSPVAFSYLKENISLYQSRVTIEQNSFLDVKLPNKVPIIMSTGASHHFNTFFLFQKANELLKENGVLLISDEFISPYSSKEERKRNLIIHHTTYMKNLLIHPDETYMKGLTKEEACLINLFENYVPVIIYSAYHNELAKTVNLCNELYHKVHTIEWHNSVSHPEAAFYRLQLLELEALLAGIDYEVEQKTYPQRFCELANSCGFTLLNHQKIYSTMGNDEFNGGTHVFAFRKEADYERS
ncbi:class I SAM-dependent methyltransferase [Pseudogracilibacillus sp. SO30301A]|uniref:class I SAM-dependent methyltransferase n=1 Tax=Pseudogracilibacillus sp. SO30301A TaxID=3098291 RepID=UPI00300E25AE